VVSAREAADGGRRDDRIGEDMALDDDDMTSTGPADGGADGGADSGADGGADGGADRGADGGADGSA
jgi:hypothetical protein